MSNKDNLSIQDRALIAQKARKGVKLLPIGISFMGTVILISYTAALMYNRFGSFSVTVNQQTFTNYGIALSETSDFKSPSPIITCRANAEITNILGSTLPMDIIGSVDGEDNGRDYLCYTFYLKNTGQKMLTYNQTISISSATQDLEKAVRVRVMSKYNNQAMTYTDYAWAKGVDENGNIVPEDFTTPFYSNNTVLNTDQEEFSPGDIMKYTIVVWIEGPDQDCKDNCIGGEFKLDMNFSVDATSVEED